ncbi:MAG: DJ-1/PfpI family protein [Alphaproteobacteria bacterium]|nr:DJ-1/PfpI family protein [Alphaproteobacteria bacterium]
MKKDTKAAFLVENGFCEREYIEMQDMFSKMNISSRIISSDAELLTAWNKLDMPSDSHWGLKYAVDYHIGDAPGYNFDILVIPGGRRSAEKLRLDPSVKSFVSGFLDSGKPVIVYNLAHEVLFHLGLLGDYHISKYNPEIDYNLDIMTAGAHDSDIVCSGNLISLSGFDHDESLLAFYIESILSGKITDPGSNPIENKAA